MASQNIHFHQLESQNIQLNRDLLPLGVYAPGLQVLTTDPIFCGKLQVLPDRKAINLRSGVLNQN